MNKIIVIRTRILRKSLSVTRNKENNILNKIGFRVVNFKEDKKMKWGIEI